MPEHVGRGDARRSMALLWGKAERPARGPKQGVTVEQIVATAIELADAEGIEAVSMRKVAEKLGRSAMSLYTYVPSKDELLDLMLDAVQGELAVAPDPSAGWRGAVEAWAHAVWAGFERHPWVLHVAGARPTLGPNETAAYEAGVRLFDDLGLTGLEMTRAFGSVASYVGGAAKSVADARAAEASTGMSDDEWWGARAPLLDELVPDYAERFPLLTRLSAEQAFDQPDRDPDDDTPYLERDLLDTFEFGLARLLDGIEAFIDRRR